MKKYLVWIVLTFALASCASPTPSPSKTSPTPSNTSPTATSIVGCYGVWQGKNHYNLEILTASGENFTGRMTYDNYQFDSSQGSYDGTYKSGILLGVYSFIAEGVFNRRDLIFKRVDKDFVEGFGEYKTVGNYDQLVDPTDVSWDNDFLFSPETTCPAVWK